VIYVSLRGAPGDLNEESERLTPCTSFTADAWVPSQLGSSICRVTVKIVSTHRLDSDKSFEEF
jgi:hypothetical protein